MLKFMKEMISNKKQIDGKSGVQNDGSSAESYWNNNPTAASQQQWTSNDIIGKEIYSRMTNGRTTEHWLSWVINDYFKDKHFSSMLSPGCGVGDHEIMIANSGLVDSIDAFDFSESSIKLAKQKAINSGSKINFYIDDLNNFEIAKYKKYDLIFTSGALHHVKELERYLSIVQTSISDNGYFIINEYVGDCYNIYNDKQLNIINRFMKCLGPDLIQNGNIELNNPTINQVMSSDPSESVRSKLIVPFLKYYFDIELFNPFGGFILHPLYPLLNNSAFNEKRAETDAIIKLLLAFEDILMSEKLLDTDFALIICRKKNILL